MSDLKAFIRDVPDFPKPGILFKDIMPLLANAEAFRTAATRESGLLEAVVAPALRARNPERRKTGMEDLQELAELAQELAQLLFWRELRQLVPA